jgi:hypothetical protein
MSAPQLLKASGKEDERYPHPFELRISVRLEDEALTQELTAINTGERSRGSGDALFGCPLRVARLSASDAFA